MIISQTILLWFCVDLVKMEIALSDIFSCGFGFFLLQPNFPGSVKPLARDWDTSWVKLFRNGQQHCQTFWQNVGVGLPALGPPLEADFAAWVFSHETRKDLAVIWNMGAFLVLIEVLTVRLNHFKGNRILLLQDCPCTYIVVKASQTCSPSCFLLPYFKKTPVLCLGALLS